MTDALSFRCSSAPDVASAAGPPVCRPVRDVAELVEHHRIRREVFVREQRLFPDDDVDDRDYQPSTLHVLGLVDGLPAGTVRLYPVDDEGLWKGDRLAVLRAHRRAQLGWPLVRLAVALAAARGGSRMIASVQVPNVRFFVTLGWSSVGAPFELLGAPHQQMTIPLAP